MTETEMERARRVYDMQTRDTPWESVKRVFRDLFRGKVDKRRAFLDLKAKVEREARSRL